MNKMAFLGNTALAAGGSSVALAVLQGHLPGVFEERQRFEHQEPRRRIGGEGTRWKDLGRWGFRVSFFFFWLSGQPLGLTKFQGPLGG